MADVLGEGAKQPAVLGARLTPPPSLLRRGRGWLRRRLAGRPDPYEQLEVDAPADVVVYFGDDPTRAYQLRQWLPALEALAWRRQVVLVLRHSGTVRWARARTSLPIVYVRTLRQLMDLYASHDYKVAVYVNHSRTNFQSLMAARMLHVHVNHGESDKRSSFSNQVRAYHRVFVAGANAAGRYRDALLELDGSALIEIGRPQLDTAHAPVLAPSTRRTLCYAPTWEGELEDNNWTSVATLGPAIVAALLAVPDARVVYKPHPRIATTTSAPVAQADRAVRRLLAAAGSADRAAGHLVLPEGEILGLLPQCTALVTDVSTVALDYLYLCPERPLFLTDPRADRDRLLEESPLAAGVDVVDTSTVDDLSGLLVDRLAADARLADRRRMRSHYFGDLPAGASTARFISAVEELCRERDKLVEEQDAGRPSRPGATPAEPSQ